MDNWIKTENEENKTTQTDRHSWRSVVGSVIPRGVCRMNVVNSSISQLRSEISGISRKRIEQIKIKLKCFWTYPFGHVWGDYMRGTTYDRMCVLCGKVCDCRKCDGYWFRDVDSQIRGNSKHFMKSLIALKRKLRKIEPRQPIIIHGELMSR